MDTKRTQPKSKEKLDDHFSKWAQSEEGKAFHKWWKNHRYSGFSENRHGRQRFGILPYEAWHAWKYKAEFYFENQQFPWPEDLDKPTTNDIEKWSAECGGSPEIDELITLVRAQWRKAADSEHGGLNVIRMEWELDGTLTKIDSAWTAEAMRAKIDEAYAYEPGQSAEDTELWKRRREESGV